MIKEGRADFAATQPNIKILVVSLCHQLIGVPTPGSPDFSMAESFRRYANENRAYCGEGETLTNPAFLQKRVSFNHL